MRKAVLTSIVLLAMAGALFAAGSQEGGAPQSSEPKTLRYAFWGNPTAIGVEQDIINAYVKLHANVTIEPVVSAYADYHSKILVMIAGGSSPEVMRIDSYYFQDFVKVKALKDVTDFAKRDKVSLSAYFQQGITENTYDGRLYGLPWGTAARYMLINLDVLEKAGIDLPKLDWTWDDYVKIVKAVTKGEGTDKVYGFGFDPSTISSILPWVWANGGDIFDAGRSTFTLDRPEATEAIQRLADLYTQGYMPSDTVSATTDILDRWFVNNRIAMREGAANNILNLQKVEGIRFEAWPMPGGRQKRSTLFKSNITAIGSSIKDMESAWDFLKFLRSPDGQGEAMYTQAKRVPPSIDDPKYWAMYADPARYPKLIEQNSKEIARTYGHNLPLRAGWLEVEQIVKPMIQSIFLGENTAQNGMKSAAPKVQAVLDKTK